MKNTNNYSSERIEEYIMTKKKNNNRKKTKPKKEKSKFAIMLDKLRRERKMTQKELGKAFFATQPTVSKWLSGESEPSIEILCQMADFFNVSVDVLIGHNDTPALSYKDVFQKIQWLLDQGTLRDCYLYQTLDDKTFSKVANDEFPYPLLFLASYNPIISGLFRKYCDFKNIGGNLQEAQQYWDQLLANKLDFPYSNDVNDELNTIIHYLQSHGIHDGIELYTEAVRVSSDETERKKILNEIKKRDENPEEDDNPNGLF